MPIRNDWTDGVDTVDAAAMNAVANLVNSNETALGAKAAKATTVSAGTGLTGGGDLSANRTLAVSYGATAGTACQGNDTRLSDTRTPTDNTVTSAKLQDGSVTTAKIGDSQVTSAKIADGTIVNADINTSAAIDVSKLGTGRVAGSNNGAATSLTLWVGTAAQYAAIGSKDASTVYVVTP